MPAIATIISTSARDPWLDMLYEAPSRDDGYFRDACVFREEIDIPDTMSAAIRYENGVQVSYSLNTFMPIEGHHLAFNGTRGRIEIRQYERQAWETPATTTRSCSMRNFGAAERIRVPHEPGGHFGGDPALHRMLFEPGGPIRSASAPARAPAPGPCCAASPLWKDYPPQRTCVGQGLARPHQLKPRVPQRP